MCLRLEASGVLQREEDMESSEGWYKEMDKPAIKKDCTNGTAGLLSPVRKRSV